MTKVEKISYQEYYRETGSNKKNNLERKKTEE